MQVVISLIDGEPVELSSLYAWLQRDDEFRGRIGIAMAPPEPGDMSGGGVPEMLTVALGSGGMGAVLAGTLSAWLSSRRAKISVEITSGDKARRIEIEAQNAAAAAQLLCRAFDEADKIS